MVEVVGDIFMMLADITQETHDFLQLQPEDQRGYPEVSTVAPRTNT